jgi:hypothetical protein
VARAALSDFAYESSPSRTSGGSTTHLDDRDLAGAELEAGRRPTSCSCEAAVLEDPFAAVARAPDAGPVLSGRHADALRHTALRTQLTEELGVDPSPSIRGLYDRI